MLTLTHIKFWETVWRSMFPIKIFMTILYTMLNSIGCFLITHAHDMQSIWPNWYFTIPKQRTFLSLPNFLWNGMLWCWNGSCIKKKYSLFTHKPVLIAPSVVSKSVKGLPPWHTLHSSVSTWRNSAAVYCSLSAANLGFMYTDGRHLEDMERCG